jgi:Zn-dependent peptidase ImmA (M78 family)/transcriptional regulator with XRE-family HTH domain
MGTFDPYRLTLARWASGMTKSELATALGLSPASVSQYESGNTQPRSSTIAEMAIALGVPASYFEASPDRRRPSPTTRSFFRSLRATRQWERDQADALAEHAYDLVAYVERRVSLPAANVPSFPIAMEASRTEIEKVAAKVRLEWNVEEGRPVANVVRLMESKGVAVCRLPATSQRVDGFSRWFETRPLVLLWDGKNDKARSRFDAAHELAHLVMHHEPDLTDKLQERQAHAFAAAFLMPAEHVIDELPRRPPRGADWDRLKGLQRRWGVSIAALLYRSRELGTLPEAGFRRAMTRYNQAGLRSYDGQALGTPEEPRLVAGATGALLHHNRWSADRLAQELRLARIQLDTLVGDLTENDASQPTESLATVVSLHRVSV